MTTKGTVKMATASIEVFQALFHGTTPGFRAKIGPLRLKTGVDVVQKSPFWGSDQDSEDGASLVGGEARQARVRRPHLLGLVTPGLPKRGILRLLRLSNVMILPSTPWLQPLDSI